jgi:S-adenosylmethionine:diacylglycerol 3-amino-3-carboxypropyl transferase
MEETTAESALIDEYRVVSKEIVVLEQLGKKSSTGLNTDQAARLDNLSTEKEFLTQKLVKTNDKKIVYKMYDNLERQLEILIRELSFKTETTISEKEVTSMNEIYKNIFSQLKESLTADKRYFKIPQYYRTKAKGINPAPLHSLLQDFLEKLKKHPRRNFIALEYELNELAGKLNSLKREQGK